MPLASTTADERMSAVSSVRYSSACCGVSAFATTDGQNTVVALSRIAWTATVAGFLIAAVLVLLNGYLGYFGVLVAVAVAAAINLRR